MDGRAFSAVFEHENGQHSRQNRTEQNPRKGEEIGLATDLLLTLLMA